VNGLLENFPYIIYLKSYIYSPGYKSLLLFVRNQAQALINQRRTFFPPSPTKKQPQTDQGKYYFEISSKYLSFFR
jgi:hypothetical protein